MKINMIKIKRRRRRTAGVKKESSAESGFQNMIIIQRRVTSYVAIFARGGEEHIRQMSSLV